MFLKRHREHDAHGPATSRIVRPANEARLSGAELLEHVWNAWLDEGVWQ